MVHFGQAKLLHSLGYGLEPPGLRSRTSFFMYLDPCPGGRPPGQATELTSINLRPFSRSLTCSHKFCALLSILLSQPLLTHFGRQVKNKKSRASRGAKSSVLKNRVVDSAGEGVANSLTDQPSLFSYPNSSRGLLPPAAKYHPGLDSKSWDSAVPLQYIGAVASNE